MHYRITDDRSRARIHQQIRDGWLMDPTYVLGDLSFVGDPSLVSLPSTLWSAWTLDLRGCRNLRHLPDGLRVGALLLSGCTSLEYLPHDLHVNHLDVSGCTALRDWGIDGRFENIAFGPGGSGLTGRTLLASGCSSITHLPNWLDDLSVLDISHCRRLERIPGHVRITGQLELAETELRGLPKPARAPRVTWDGYVIPWQNAFRPDSIMVSQILGEPNVQVRRDMIDLFGFERLVELVETAIIHEDRDPGGRRMLVRVRYPNDDWRFQAPDEMILSVKCPSTGHRYYLGVPPRMRTCHQAAAWLAGFDDPRDYKPLIEA